MILILDGYNIIHRARLALSKPLEAQRNEITQLAASHARKKNVQIVLFFDNQSNDEFWERPEHPLVKVIFSRSADDAIVEWISKQPNARNIEVATDDKSLRDRSKHYGASVISTGELMHRFCPDSFQKPLPPRRKFSDRSVSDKPQKQSDFDQINKTLPW